jgi:cytochrome c5
VATGKAALVASVTNGKGAMPPKGGNTALSADDLGAAVDYMISNAK